MRRALSYFRSERRESMKPTRGNLFAQCVRLCATVSNATEGRGRAVRRAHFLVCGQPPCDPNTHSSERHGKRQCSAEEKKASFSRLRASVSVNPRGPVPISRCSCVSVVGVQGSTVPVFAELSASRWREIRHWCKTARLSSTAYGLVTLS